MCVCVCVCVCVCCSLSSPTLSRYVWKEKNGIYEQLITRIIYYNFLRLKNWTP